MKMLKRRLEIDLPAGQSAFLWGARKTGKTTYLKENFPESIVFDFLKTDLFLDMSKEPALLRERLLARESHELEQPVILDEVQKVPQVLDEVHWLIENRGLRFILCGSSARKLKRGHGNLLGGRAWRYELFPLTSVEIGGIDLLRALNQGLIPSHYLQDASDSEKSLEAYLQDYLKEEVFAEGLARNVQAFARFFDAFGYSNGQETNYSNIARECGVDSKTVREYFQILIDTLLAVRVDPFKKKQSRRVITKSSKCYMFDVGVAGYLSGRKLKEEKGPEFGKALEHFILMELVAFRAYTRRRFNISFWRTRTGLEVDFVLGEGETAVEVKGASKVSSRDLRGLKSFMDEHTPKKALVVCNEKEKRRQGGIIVLPWSVFISELWAGRII